MTFSVLCVDWYGVVTLGGKKLYRLEFMLMNVDFAKGLRLLVHLREFRNQRLVCIISVQLVPCFCQHLFKKGMSSSSDTVSLSSSSSGSMESERGVGRRVEEESTDWPRPVING